jgi:hypothetical protein
MSPEQALLARGVDINLLVGVGMMMTMYGGPPESPPLNAEKTEQGEEELNGAGGFVGLVAEVSVVDAGDEKHPHHVEEDTGGHGDGTPSDPENPEASQMEDGEGDNLAPFHPFGKCTGSIDPSGKEVGVDRPNEWRENAHGLPVAFQSVWIPNSPRRR